MLVLHVEEEDAVYMTHSTNQTRIFTCPIDRNVQRRLHFNSHYKFFEIDVD